MNMLEAGPQKTSAATGLPGEAPASGHREAPGAAPAANNLDLILDIPMTVSVQLGTARMLIRELLQLGQGSVIELEKLAGEPMEVLVNNKLVARGEVVVVNEKFGIRLTDVVSATERIEQLK
jgi:flagellar motor switch protein FliN/FliY